MHGERGRRLAPLMDGPLLPGSDVTSSLLGYYIIEPNKAIRVFAGLHDHPAETLAGLSGFLVGQEIAVKPRKTVWGISLPAACKSSPVAT